MMEDAQMAYTEKRVTLQGWPTLKPTFPMQQVPVYQQWEGPDAVFLFHSAVIRRYLADKLNLYGNNISERWQCGMVVESILDSQVNVGTFMWNPKFEELRASYQQEALPPLLEKLQNHKARNIDSDFFWVGKDITYADFVAWCFLDYVRALSTPVLAEFKALYDFYTGIAERPNIASYLASDRRPKNLSGFDGPFWRPSAMPSRATAARSPLRASRRW